MESLGKIEYPVGLAPRGNTIDEYKSKDGKKVFKVPDPYRFLEDPDSVATKKWVQAQNDITNKFLSKLDLQEKVFNKMKFLSKYTKMSIP